MTSPIPVVTIGSQPYFVYGDTPDADLYLAGSTSASQWHSETDQDTKARALVSATRWLDAQRWQGEKTSTTQELAWPRTGIADANDSDIPMAVVNASFELAAALLDDPELRTTLQAAVARRLQAGSVSIEYWRGQSVQVTTPFPKIVMDLIGQWLAGSAVGADGVITFGTCEENPTQEDFGFNRGL